MSNIPPQARNLYCEADENNSLRLLSVTPNLQSLVYHYLIVIDSNMSEDAYFYNLATLSRALKQVQKTFKHLALGVEFPSDSIWPADMPPPLFFGVRNDLGSLQQFEKMESLTIPFNILFGHSHKPKSVKTTLEKLPQSIRRLHLKDDCADLGDYQWRARQCLDRLRNFLKRSEKNYTKPGEHELKNT